ncbi:DUF2076 domain-containing protein [Azospirillum halopraeferens]|uniref:DUF2076 domain-containing protein n=1 Tax=Azospirillum halopraeferens TaxID=34010 RepID=UPI000428C93D|nr:DUF2076 domain-containing protein [Azospirillum halopraeferens]
MDQTERQIIDELFAKLRQAEAQSGPRDAQAESYIRDQVNRQPASPYLMTQAMVMMEQALAASQARTQELEQQLRERPAGGGGIFGGLFGGGARPAPAPAPAARPGSPWNRQAGPQGVDPRIAGYAQQGRQGGGFLAGAMQTALGVAGGVLIGNMLADAFMGGGEAAAAEPPAAAPEPAAYEEPPVDDSSDWGDFGGDEDI